MCAAPGGKTTHIATLGKNQCTIFAIDRSLSKVKSIEGNCKRLGITCVKALHLNSTNILLTDASFNLSDPIKGFPKCYFDKILLDPPCSGIGNRPRFKDNITLKNLKGFADYQTKLFCVAVDLLKPGGILVFSTCTINPAENEEMVAYALKTYPSLQLHKQEPYLGLPGLKTSSLTQEQCQFVQRFSPNFALDTIGFFIAAFQKVN